MGIIRQQEIVAAPATTVAFVIINGELRAPHNPSSEMVMRDHAITITPNQNSIINVYLINRPEKSFQQNITVNFNVPHAEVNLFGLFQGYEKNTLAITTTMNHAVPHCTSRQVWKGVMHDASKASFEGLIVVAKHAQKTVAHLSNKNLLLSRNAQVSTRPFLKIDADDVKCSHGATVGCLDEDALFYLRSRGLPEIDARKILIDAFVNEIMERVGDDL